ncbi:MAG: hypothetical protein ACO1N0_02135 [Fluviicola sp.]
MKQENNIEKLFQGAFDNFEVTPPVSVKMEIDKQLGKKKIKPRWIFWWSISIILLLTGGVFAVVNGGFYHSSSIPGLRASEQQQIASNRSSKTTEPDSNDPLTSEGVSGNNHPESKENEKPTGIDPANAGNQKVGSVAVKESEKVKPSPKNSLKNKPKKGTAFSVKKRFSPTSNNGKMSRSASGKNEGSNSTNQTSNTKNGLSEKSGSDSKNGLKTKGKKRTAFIGKQKNTGGKTEEIKPFVSEEKPAVIASSEKIGLSEKEEKQPEIIPSKSGEEYIAEKKPQPADSITNSAADSLEKNDNQDPLTPPKKDSKVLNWMVEIYGGPRFGAKTSKTDFALKSANSYQIGLGFSRRLNLGPLKYVTLDGEYGGGKESYRQSTTTSSVYFVSTDSIPVLDSTQTDTLYYVPFDNYDTLNQTTEVNNSAQITRFAFGLKAQFNFNLGSGFGIAVSPGYYYSRSKYQFSDSSSTSSSSQILLNLSLYYDWNRFRFRVGLDSRYELMGKNQYAYFDRRKSVLFSPQFGVGFKF